MGLPTPVAIGTGLVAGLGTYALGDAALREAISTGYDYLFPDNAGTLSTDLYKDYTPEAAAFGKGGQLFGSFGGFQGYLSRLLRKKTPEDVNFGNADLGLRIDSLKRQYGIGEPGLSFGRFTHQGPQDLGVWQNAILNKKLSALEAKKGFTNVTEAITRDIIERYNANPGMFNLVETLAGAGAAGGAIVSEQLYPGETLPALGFETAGAIFTPATTLGRIVSATSPYLKNTFDFVTTPSEIIPKTGGALKKARDFVFNETHEQQKKAAQTWFNTAVENFLENRRIVLEKEGGDPNQVPDPQAFVEQLMQFFADTPYTMPNGTVINTIDDIKKLKMNLVDAEGVPLDLTPAQITAVDGTNLWEGLFDAIENQLGTYSFKGALKDQQLEFNAKKKAQHNKAMNALGKMLFSFASTGDVDALKAATSMRGDLLEEYLEAAIMNRLVRAQQSLRTMGGLKATKDMVRKGEDGSVEEVLIPEGSAIGGFEGDEQVINLVENLKNELQGLNKSFRGLASKLYEQAGAQGAEVIPEETYKTFIQMVLTGVRTGENDVVSLPSGRFEPTTRKITQPEDGFFEFDVDEVPTGVEHKDAEAYVMDKELLQLYLRIARQPSKKTIVPKRTDKEVPPREEPINPNYPVEQKPLEDPEPPNPIEYIVGENAQRDPGVAANLEKFGLSVDDLEPLDAVLPIELVNFRHRLLDKARGFRAGPSPDLPKARQYETLADAIQRDLTREANAIDPLLTPEGELKQPSLDEDPFAFAQNLYNEFGKLEPWQQSFILANTLSRKISDAFSRSLAGDFLQRTGRGDYRYSNQQLIDRMGKRLLSTGQEAVSQDTLLRERLANLAGLDDKFRITGEEAEIFFPDIAGKPRDPRNIDLGREVDGVMEYNDLLNQIASTEDAYNVTLQSIIAQLSTKGGPDTVGQTDRIMNVQERVPTRTTDTDEVIDVDLFSGLTQRPFGIDSVDNIVKGGQLPQLKRIVTQIFSDINPQFVNDFGNTASATMALKIAQDVQTKFQKLKKAKRGIYRLLDDQTPNAYIDRIFGAQNKKYAAAEFNSFLTFIEEVGNPEPDLAKLAPVLRELGIEEKNFNQFRTELFGTVQNKKNLLKQIDLVKEAGISGIFQSLLKQANSKINNDVLTFTPDSIREFARLINRPISGKKGDLSIIDTLLTKGTHLDKSGTVRPGFISPDYARNLTAFLNKISALNMDPNELASIKPNDPDLGLKILIGRLMGASAGRTLADTAGTRATIQYPAIGAKFGADLVDKMPTSVGGDILLEMVKPGNEKLLKLMLEGAHEGIGKKGKSTYFAVNQHLQKLEKGVLKLLRGLFSPAIVTSMLNTEVSPIEAEDVAGAVEAVIPSAEAEEMPAYRRYDPRLPENQLQRPDKEPVNVRPIERPLTMLPRPAIQPTQPQPRTMGPASPPTPDRMRFAGLFPEDITSGLIRQGAVNQGIGSLAG